MPKIITNHWAKPIPDRQFDWSAMEDGGNEMLCGWGQTEEDAVEDLKRLWAEYEDGNGEWQDWEQEQDV